MATVANGVVTAVAPGTADITVTTVDGGKTASCTVTVKAAEEPNEPDIPWPPKPSNSTAQPVLPFTDVPVGAWYYDSVKNAWENNLRQHRTKQRCAI